MVLIDKLCISQAPDWEWAKSAGGNVSDAGWSVAVDASGSVYVTGDFRGASITFGSTILTNTTIGSREMFIAKYDANGNVLWAKSAGGDQHDFGSGIATDASGNVYVTGTFTSSSMTIGSTILLNSSGGSGSGDIFIAKYDSTGNVIWAKSAGSGFPQDFGNGIATDASGNVYATGDFSGSIITFGSTTLTKTGVGFNGYIVKYDSTGNVLWAKNEGGFGSVINKSVNVDTSGNVYVTGQIAGSIIFGTDTLVGEIQGDIYIIKYNANGNILWAKSAGGNRIDIGWSIATDATGNAYVTGRFNSDFITFGSFTLTNSRTHISLNTHDMFVVKYNANGNVEWAKNGIGTGGGLTNDSDVGRGVTTDGLGNVYVTGFFRGSTITFDPVTLTNTASGFYDMFVVKYDSFGNALWAKNPVGGGAEFGFGITINNAGNVYVTGLFASSTFTFDSTTLSGLGMYVAKLGGAPVPCPNGLTASIAGTNVSCSGGSDGTIDLTVIGGASPYDFLWSNGAATEDITGLTAGIYDVTVTDANGCTVTASITITEPSLLIADAGSDITICSGESTFIGGSPTASGGTAPFVYFWSPATGLSSTTAANPVASPASTTIYTVTVTDANGCVETDDIILTVNPAPDVDAGSDETVLFNSCPQSPPSLPDSLKCIDLIATIIGGTSPYGFAWSPVAGLDDPNIASPEACPVVTTTYTVTVTDVNGCVATDAVTVTAIDFCDPNIPCIGNNCNKTPVCHVATCTEINVNKNANCNSANSLCAHLAHGDIIGPCNCKMGSNIDEGEKAEAENEIAKTMEDIKNKTIVEVYPNPFSYSTTIMFNLPETGKVTLEIYNLIGSKIVTLFEGFAGEYNTVEFQGKELPAGVYFYKLTTGERIFYNKLILSR